MFLSGIFAKLDFVARKNFDYIIAGGGMAGLSLAFYLNESSLRDGKILVIDRGEKNTNDRTFCFWEKGESAFEEIVFHRWKSLQFYGTKEFEKKLDIGEYEYKMIRAVDFYEFTKRKITANPNIEIVPANVESIENETVKTNVGMFEADEFIFDSVTCKNYDNPKYCNLLQHFTGWKIETKRDFFDSKQATLFDFRVAQHDECRFVYVLPTSAKNALIEFTVFSDNLLAQSEYDSELRKYISEVLSIENYKIIEIETGIIPMSDEPHEHFPAAKIIRIGTAGGFVKPSTGYSFERTQRRLKSLVKSLEAKREPLIDERKPLIINWKNYLDSVLLDVLRMKKHSAADVFTHLFRGSPAWRVLSFLDEETSFAEDFQIMQSVPRLPFAKSAVSVLARKITRR